jgi:cell division protein FtsI/penicillin-binding protein 2
MKTGTASEPRHGYHVNYIGIGPLPTPQVAFCVRVTFERTSGRAARAGRAVTAALLDGLAEARYRARLGPVRAEADE